MYACVCPPSCALLLLAFAAAARPRHRFQTSLRDRSLADLTNPVCALPDPRQRLIDSSQKSPVSLMQLNLQLRFLVGIGLVNHISLQAPCCWHQGSSVALGRRLLLAPGLERRPGQTTSPAASPTTVSCIVANRPGP